MILDRNEQRKKSRETDLVREKQVLSSLVSVSPQLLPGCILKAGQAGDEAILRFNTVALVISSAH